MKTNHMNHYLIVLFFSLLASCSYTKDQKGVRFVKCSNEIGPMNLAQIEVYRTNGDNVAYGKPVEQSSYYSNVYPGRLLVDGRGLSFAHTKKEKDNWMRIDLGMSHYDIYRLVIINRKDCCKSRAIKTVCELQDENKETIEKFPMINKQQDLYEFISEHGKKWESEGNKCDYLNFIKTIRIECDKGYGEYINLSEVQVFDDQATNIALNRLVTASSLYSPSYPPSKLTDGSLAGFAHTQNALNEWFKIHLDQSYSNIRSIVVRNRLDCCKGRINGCSVYLEDEYGNGLDRYVFIGTHNSYTFVPKCQNYNFKKKKLIK